MTNALVAAAHSYLGAGLSIIALTGKLPNTAIHKHGLKDYLSGIPENEEDNALIERVFTHQDTTGIAIVLTNQIVVVDIDGEVGILELAAILDVEVEEMVAWARALDTPVASTGRGLHLYFLSTRPQGTVKLGTKLDLKGEGGYVAAPPSRHPSGAIYEWGVERRLVDDESGGRVHIDWLPDKIVAYLKSREQMLDAKRVEYEPVAELALLWASEDGKHLKMIVVEAKPPIEALAKRVAAEPVDSGNGNRLLHWAACAAAENGYTMKEAYAALVPAVTEGWSQPLTAQAARSTIRSAFKNTMVGR